MADVDALLWGDTSKLVTLGEIRAAQLVLREFPDVLRTPMLPNWPLELSDSSTGGADGSQLLNLHLKLESLQTTGSFKIRGMRYKLHASDIAQLRAAVSTHAIPQLDFSTDAGPRGPVRDCLRFQGVVTLSAGNAGRAVSYMCQQEGIDAKVFMPETAPDHKKAMMEGLGATVVKVPGEALLDEVAACITAENRVLVHPFDDLDLIRGHASCGLEILEDCPDVDVVVVCVGGGGLIAGIAAAVKLAGSKARVIGVEPTGAPSMHMSRASGQPEWCPDGGKTDTIAEGLAPPFAGHAAFKHIEAFVDDLVLVTDDEMREATRVLFRAGIVCEVPGAAAVAAVMAGRCGDLTGLKVACTISGRNVGVDEYAAALAPGTTAAHM